MSSVKELEGLPHEPREIERKFLLDQFPLNLEHSPYDYIEQGYLHVDDEEIRVRRITDMEGNHSHILTRKTGTGLVRGEYEAEISQEAFDILWPTTEGRRVVKKRYSGFEAGVSVSIDRYEGVHDGLVVVEVEFKSEDEASQFQQPSWTKEEITGRKGYSNKDLACNGLPKAEVVPDLSETEEKVRLRGEKMNAVIDRLRDIDTRVQASRPVLVGVGGRTSAGKTTAFISRVQEEFPGRVAVISTDDFARGTEFVEQETVEGREVNYDHPRYYDTHRARGILDSLRDGTREVQLPVFNLKKGKGEPDGEREFSARDIIVVEGLYALSDDLRDIYDLTAFVDISLHGSVMRRLLRDIHRTNMTPDEILTYYFQVVEPMYQSYIKSSRNAADFVIENEYNPDTESAKTGVTEHQVKFRGKPNNIKFQQSGGQILGSTIQEDQYFAFDRHLKDTGEALRIRKEGGKYTLAYKGPIVRGSDFRTRNKFEVRLSEEDAELIMNASGEFFKKIVKDREFRFIDGVMVMVDQVTKIEGGEEISLGEFVEFHLPNPSEDSHKKVEGICNRIGIDPASHIAQSYFEM